jgi:hypothetical protein
MSDESNEARVGHNESIFREINERAEEIGTAVAGPTEFLCECANRLHGTTRRTARHLRARSLALAALSRRPGP